MAKPYFYFSKIDNFIVENENLILGKLVNANTFNLEDTQKKAWKDQIQILKKTLRELEGFILFEYSIPRMGKRVDNILIINGLIFVLDFNVGANLYSQSAINQVMDYALDLKNFHEESLKKQLIPILVSTESSVFENRFSNYKDNILKPLRCNKNSLHDVLKTVLLEFNRPNISVDQWVNSKYKPTPTIIEAAQALYKNHDVKDISRSEGGAINLSKTTTRINEIIDYSKRNNIKSICFVTGVPGAGKTLAGLNIATSRTKISKEEHAVFLSGNGPLVSVLREALVRDKLEVVKKQGITKTEVRQEVEPFIQNIHHFRDEYLRDKSAPIERVVIFDEAQRAWNVDQTSNFMKRKRGDSNFLMSEPEFLIGVMNRHQDWCSIICLIGGGQEINKGEAGLEEWLVALREHYPNWNIFISNRIVDDTNYLKDNLDLKHFLARSKKESCLHLSVSMRSFRAENLSDFVEELLRLNREQAKLKFNELKNNYPIYVTRSLQQAKCWLRKSARGSERFGLLASSGAYRLRPEGIDVKSSIDVNNWFLNDPEDVRSSYYLEQAATQFDVQGLELDWACVAWDIDLYLKSNQWEYRRFRGASWQNIIKKEDQEYLLNAYRVLLTRARQGMILYVPKGDDVDLTRPTILYDSIYNYLVSLGIPILKLFLLEKTESLF